MGDSKSLPFGVEYAKSGRSSCKGCRLHIDQGDLRMSFRIPSPFFDGLQDNWHHFECFWIRLKTEINESSIRGIEILKWEDAERIRQAIEGHISTPSRSARSATKVELKVENAKSATGKCSECKEKIAKGEMKIGLKTSWYHLDCFPKEQTKFEGTAKDIKGYYLLDEFDRERLEDEYPLNDEDKDVNENGDGEPSSKKPRVSMSTPKRSTEDVRNKSELKKQSKEMWTLREHLSDLTKHEMEFLIEYNGYRPPSKGGDSARLDRLVDMAMFGVPEDCPKCSHVASIGYSISDHGYRCFGYISEYTKCSYTAKQPDRRPFKIPRKLREDHPDLEQYHKRPVTKRVYPTSFQTQSVVEMPSSSRRATEAYNYKSAMDEDAPIFMKNGYAVDPKCDSYEHFHVYIDEHGKPWQTTLGVADVQTNRNSYYKLQLVKHDKHDKYMLFRAWGRIGTHQGGSKTESYGQDLDAAQAEFEKQFRDKSRNEWDHAHRFVKKPGCMDLLEMEVLKDRSEENKKLSMKNSKSKLPKSIQELMTMIFDVDAMKDSMREMKIDMDKLPLGKLSRKHILNAYAVLTDLQNAFAESIGSVDNDIILDATNRFYTLIPHNTGLEPVRKLDNENIIKDKSELLDNLLEIHLAYSIVKRETDDEEMDPIDESYAKLNTNMEVLDKDGEEFKNILKYAKNTHASTHDTYSLDIVDVYRIERYGEKDRFTSKLGNRSLLWHGSRLSNYVGILTQGLRIAPPEAPVTGYMFGKGIYFADMVSKSANYCHALEKEGLLLLCDVALGDMQEEVHAKMITKLNKGKNSCKGLGMTFPNPNEVHYTEDGVMIPYGKQMTAPVDKKKPLDLLYNEYIVYDVKQVNIKYMVRAKFSPTVTLL